MTVTEARCISWRVIKKIISILEAGLIFKEFRDPDHLDLRPSCQDSHASAHRAAAGPDSASTGASLHVRSARLPVVGEHLRLLTACVVTMTCFPATPAGLSKRQKKSPPHSSPTAAQEPGSIRVNC